MIGEPVNHANIGGTGAGERTILRPLDEDYEKAGFVTEGLMRHALYWEGEWVDPPAGMLDAPQPPS